MKKKKGRKGFMAIKIDLKKAYNKIKWEFVAKMLEKLRPLDKLRNVTMKCISFSFINILWNEAKFEEFKLS